MFFVFVINWGYVTDYRCKNIQHSLKFIWYFLLKRKYVSLFLQISYSSVTQSIYFIYVILLFIYQVLTTKIDIKTDDKHLIYALLLCELWRLIVHLKLIILATIIKFNIIYLSLNYGIFNIYVNYIVRKNP